MTDCRVHVGQWRSGKAVVSGGKPVPVPLFPSQISQGCVWN